LSRAARNVFIGRQPILDTNGEVVAYELLFRTSAQSTGDMGSESKATARVISDIFSDMGLARVLGDKLGFVNIGEEFLMSDMVYLLPADRLVLEILETVPVTDDVVARCRELKSRGFRLAIDDYVGAEGVWEPLLWLVDIVKVDVLGVDREDMSALSRNLHRRKLKLLAEKVETPEVAAQVAGLGFSYFQGFFFARPLVLESRTMDPMVSALLDIFFLVLKDAETNEIDQAIRLHVDLSVSLIKVANVVGTTPMRQVATVRQAILAMGRNQLRRWIQLLLFSTPPSENRYTRAVFHLALVRARIMEILAGRWSRPDGPDPDEAFMAGMLSLGDVLLETSLALLLRDLPVDPSFKDALLEGKGPIGRLLELSKTFERSDFPGIERCLEGLPVTEDQFLSAQTESLVWADEVARIFA
jgi:c-di-GMP-related signal transduction protein